MKQVLYAIGCGVAAVLVIMAAAWAALGNQFFMYKWLAPNVEEVRREVFENSKQYRHGTIQQLDKLRVEYMTIHDDEAKRAIAKMALRMTAEWDMEDLPSDIRYWLEDISKLPHPTTKE